MLNARVASLKLMRWVTGSQCNDFSRVVHDKTSAVAI